MAHTPTATNQLVDLTGQPESDSASNDGCAITYLSRELAELQGLAERQLACAQRAVGSVDAALELAVEAWQEREDLRGRYFEMLRGVLRLLDDCADLLAHDETLRQAILQRFESLLADHRVQRIAVEPGDRFQPAIHHCEKVEHIAVASRGLCGSGAAGWVRTAGLRWPATGDSSGQCGRQQGASR